MSTTNQTFKAIFEQALLANAAYATGLGGLGYGENEDLLAAQNEDGAGNVSGHRHSLGTGHGAYTSPTFPPESAVSSVESASPEG